MNWTDIYRIPSLGLSYGEVEDRAFGLPNYMGWAWQEGMEW